MRVGWAFIVPFLVTTHVHADTLSGTRAQKLTETKHDVRIRVRDGVAIYKVQRTFKNDGKLHEEAVLDLGLPFGAAATGLRIKTPSGWYSGELMRAERAAELYQELTGFGAHTVKDPALLSWRWANELTLQVFPVAPDGGESTIEYTLTGPTSYQDGRYVVSYPMADAGLASPQLEVKGHNAQANVWLNGKPIGGGTPALLATPPVPPWADAALLPERYAFSEIAITDALEAKKLSVAIDVRHTYRGDLKVQLVSPDGKWRSLVEQSGGSENDLRVTESVELSTKEAVPIKGTWRLVVSDHAALDVGTIDSWSMTLEGGDKDKKYAAVDTPKFIPDAPNGAAGNMGIIQIAPPPIRTVAARLGRVEASKTKQFFRLEVDAAPELRKVPAQLSVVFVVDTSKSNRGRGLNSQLATVRSFLKNAPQAKAEVVVYRREATRLFDDFVSAPAVAGLLNKAEADGKLTLGNGSALDEGIRVATRALQGQRGSRMIVMLSDDLLRPAWTNESSLEQLDKLPLYAAHMVLPQTHHAFTGDARERRDDRHALSPLAMKTGGILLHIDRAFDEDKELDDVTLGLVRPTRIDDFVVRGVSLSSSHGIPTVLREGQGIREMALLETAPGSVRLSGKIWSRTFSRKVEGPYSFSEATAAFVFSHDMHGTLSIEEQVRVAFVGKVVSPVTSYLAVEPGVRPSPVGLELSGIGEGGGGRGEGIGLGSVSTIGHGGGCPTYDLKKDVAARIQACVATHKPAATWSMKLKVDTTFDEVVDVTPTGSQTAAFSACIVDAAWTADLVSCRFTKERSDFTVSLP